MMLGSPGLEKIAAQMRKKENSGEDYLLTGHGKIPFTLDQMKIMRKRKNSADNAQELFKLKLEQIINQMKMYDHFHNFEDK